MISGAVAATTTALLIACSSSDGSISITNADGGPPQDGGYLTDAGGFVSTCTPPTAPTTIPAACGTITEDVREVQSPPQLHLPVGTNIDYCTNPPSGGAHYPIWANFGEITHPIPWPYLVHDEEHGAILLLYNCPDTDGGTNGCPDLVDQLRQVVTRAATDPICDPGVKRFVIVPAPTIPTKIAAAAWGATLTADCVDGPTFDAFVKAHYGNGPEVICAEGQAFP